MARSSFTSAGRRFIGRRRIGFSPAGYLYSRDILPPVEEVPGLNGPESRVYWALHELKIDFLPQKSLFGGNILGGARTDFLLPDYRIDLEYAGPLHSTTEGRGRDTLRNIGVLSLGYTVRTLTERDLPNLKQRILQLIGRPVFAVLAGP